MPHKILRMGELGQRRAPAGDKVLKPTQLKAYHQALEMPEGRGDPKDNRFLGVVRHMWYTKGLRMPGYIIPRNHKEALRCKLSSGGKETLILGLDAAL